ncbi:MAG: hypothetical protein GX028_04935 [Clostridiaceae bacterium]|nr:hypothetical protein [Clostridiaceae bacterium]
MIDLARLTKLKLIELLNRPVILVVLLVLPLLLGSIAGVANVRNTGKDIYLAVVDQDQSAASSRLASDLESKGWTVYEADQEQAERYLLRSEVDGILTIKAGFEAGLDDFDQQNLFYSEAEGSMVTTMVREVIVASVLPMFSRESMIKQLSELYELQGEIMPPELPERLGNRIEEIVDTQTRIKIEYFGKLVIAPTLTFVVSDYSMEVFFLSIYAILGSLFLSKAALHQRLLSTASGLRKDYISTIISLLILGELQIIIYTMSMLSLMKQPVVLSDLFVLSVFLFLMLGVGQLLSLIEESLRLYLSLMLMLFLAAIGGCFFQLSSNLLLNYGQYSPHGWALSTLSGTRVTPIWLVIPIALLLISLGYMIQKKRVY